MLGCELYNIKKKKELQSMLIAENKSFLSVK